MLTTTTAQLDSFNPATGALVGSVPITPASEIPAIVARAREVQAAWGAMSARERADTVRPAGQALADRADELGELLTREMGKPLAEGVGECRGTGEGLSDEVDEIAKAVAPQTLEGEGVTTTLYHDPLGVCAAITPWNFPLAMPHWMTLPALVTGNAVVLKPSEQTPLIAQAYADTLNEFLPSGVLQVVHGADEQGKALVAADVDLIAFTGSKAVGQKIMAAAAGGLKRLILELGSKDPLIVLEGADLDAAAAFAARNSFRNCGQVCVSTERIYVQQSVKDAFMAKLIEQSKIYAVGDGMAEGTVIGPMISGEQKAHVERQLADALARGAKIVFGGETREGQFISPTVLDGVNHEMDIMRTETFGPVACVMGVRDADEAATLANDSEYGLGGVVFGPDAQARGVARRLNSAMVGINRGIGGAPGSPWVGAKQSGYSYHSGPMGHRQFCQVRVVSEPASPTAP
ncbi:MAG: aldehyde dehydrogenase family protein [Phycisphaerales bacterium]